MLKPIKTSLFLSLTIAATSFATASDVTSAYVLARDRFKERLFMMQGGLMNRTTYLQCIEPHLQKAETELAIPKHLTTKHELNYQDECYMEELAHCNVALFHSHVNPKSPYAEMGYEKCERNLKSAIRSVKRNDKLTLDVDTEFIKTAYLLTKANEEFYKKLSLGNKALLWFMA